MTWTVADIPDQQGRTAIITGANSGIGFEAARELAKKGARVVLACRNESKGNQAVQRILESHPTASVELMLLDLSRLASVAGFAEEVCSRFQHLDLLINNAGVMVPPMTRTEDGFELQFGTNHLGHFALTARLLPLLQDQPGARVVSISSIAHKTGKIDFANLNAEKRYRPWAAYSQSKLANLLFTFELERRLRTAGAEAIAVAAHPGWTATDLQRTSPAANFLNRYVAMEPLGGALPTLMAATASNIQGGDYIGPTGFQEMRGAPGRARATRRARDTKVAGRLWQVSEESTGLTML